MTSKSLRKPTEDELRLIESLIIRSERIMLSSAWKETLMVQNMDDGEMGSLLLFDEVTEGETREFGKEIATCSFADADGVTVSATLNIDTTGRLFELDVWKTDFRPLIKIPQLFNG